MERTRKKCSKYPYLTSGKMEAEMSPMLLEWEVLVAFREESYMVLSHGVEC